MPRPITLTLLSLVVSLAPALAAGLAESLEVTPTKLEFTDSLSRRQLLVTAKAGAKVWDETDAADVTVENPKIATVTAAKEIIPLADGQTQVVVRVGKQTQRIPIVVTGMTKARPVDFRNEIVPILSKLGCNGGGCHGKSGGQNGFVLSLLGFEPENDYRHIVLESRGRRIFPAAPAHSLLLQKASAQVPHGGGKRMQVDDDNYRLLLRWIDQGMPEKVENPAVVDDLEIVPPRRVLGRQQTQRLAVLARFSDGRQEDVTRCVQFQSNADNIAAVDEIGRVKTKTQSGETAIMVRYMDRLAVFRATVPLETTLKDPPPFQPTNFIDTHVSRKWKDLGLAPSERCTDQQFIRRLMLDLCGRLPAPAEVKSFVESKTPSKRTELIETLLASRDYAGYQALRWGAILRNQRGDKADLVGATHAMALWLQTAFNDDMPYDQFARAILTATGPAAENPPAIWFQNVRTTEDNVDNVAQVFLGTRIQCARCHHHPYEKWGQDDYYGLASFFSRVSRKPFTKYAGGQDMEAVVVQRSGMATHPKTGQPVPAKGLDGPAVMLPDGVDPRMYFVDWMTDPKNPFFATTVVNRVWGSLFGRGIVDPIDDIRLTNPPSNPELIDALAKDFVAHQFSMKHLYRTIGASTVYQLASEPNDNNIHDEQNFARHYPRRLPAEVLLDAIDGVTGSKTKLGLPDEGRTVEFPDEKANSYFLDVFGRPARASSCECERQSEANLSQSLHLINSNDIQSKLNDGNARAAQLAKDPRSDDEKVTELFLRAYGRPPKPTELEQAQKYRADHPDAQKFYQDLIWALLNTKEFLFNL